MTAIRHIAAAGAALLLLAGCTPGAPGAAGASGFCTEFEANGGTGATIGPLQSWVTKEDLLPDVQGRLDAMGDIVPPAEISSEWDVMKTYYTDVLAAVEQLPEGGTLMESGGFAELGQAPDEYEAVVRDLTAAANARLFEVVEAVADVHDTGRGRLPDAHYLRGFCARTLDTLITQRDAFILRNQDVLLKALALAA